jgi:LysR family transcriptional regulator, cyn operon transcriptional activator
MDIRQLRYFLELAQTEHLTQAAQHLFVTQSTLSHGLRQLEQSLGVELFDRVGRGLRLSQAGAAFRAHALRALRELETGKMALADLDELRAGRLTIGVFPTFLHTVVPATVAAFHDRYPGVSVEARALRAGSIEEQLLRGDLDLGIAFHPTLHEDIETEALFEERLQGVVHRQHRLAGHRVLPLAEFARSPLALLPRSYATRRRIDEQFRAAGIRLDVRVEIESVEALLGLCAASRQLASIVPERAASQTPELIPIELDSPGMVRQAGLLWPRSGSRSPAATAFARLLRARVSGSGQAGPESRQ